MDSIKNFDCYLSSPASTFPFKPVPTPVPTKPKETAMRQTRHLAPTDSVAEAQRHAYNAAFEELNLSWHWDAATYAGVQARGRDGLRDYLQAEHAHLLRAYDADFLVNAIETAKARYCKAEAAPRTHTAAYARPASYAHSAA
jgi:hypothetical protein